MPALYEKYRPRNWSEVVGQEAAVSKLLSLRDRRGFGGQVFYITGQSGQGKTTIARLIAAEVADEFGTFEIGGPKCTAEFSDKIEQLTTGHAIGGRGWAIIVNEVQSFTQAQIDRLLQVLEQVPEYVVWIFTTTNTGDRTVI
jgi:DNA polymerase III gamma/tau subunit